MEENMIDVNETEKYLPIGTVVLLKGATKRLMIAGYCAVDQEKKDEMWDYSGCMYPEGFLSSQQSFLFDHSQIAKIYSLGYKDNEEEEFQQKLVNYINSKDSEEDASEDSEDDADTAPVSNEADSSVDSGDSVEEVVEEEKVETNQLLDESSNVDSTSFNTVISNSEETPATPVEEAPVSAEPVTPTSEVEAPSVEAVEPVSTPVAETPVTPVEQTATNVEETPTEGAQSNSADVTNPNNAADLSEFDQWLNQTGPYANNGENNTNQ